MFKTNNTQSNYFLKMINLVLIVSFFLLSFQIKAQQKPLPKNAKLKTIKYKEDNYAAIGYVLNNEFVVGQKITFISTEEKETDLSLVTINSNVLTDTIISGTYFVKDGISYLEGKKNEIKVFSYHTKRRVFTKGLFKITNSTYKNVSNYDPLNDKVSIKLEKSTLSVNPLPDEKFWTEIRKNLNKLPITLLVAKNLDIEIADVYSYQGYLDENTPVSLQKQEDSYILKIEFMDKILELYVGYESLNKNNFLSFHEIIKENSKNVKLIFKNGNVFIGEIFEPLYGDKYEPRDGEYRFANGDIVLGNVNFEFNKASWEEYYLGLNDKSKTIFADGNVTFGDWSEKYKKVLPEEEWNEVLKTSKTLSEIRDKFESNEKFKHIVAEQKRKQQKNEITEQEKQIAKQRLHNALINKYGNYWGELIFNREFTPGMTKDMVLEFTSENFYKISKAIRDGNYIEIWEFDPQKLAQETVKKEGEKGVMTLLALSLMENLGMGNINSQFPTLVFRNDKLTDIYQN